MHRLAALALVVGCSSPSMKPFVLGEPPSYEMNVSLTPNVAFDAQAIESEALRVARELGYEVEYAGAVVDPDLITVALNQTHHGLPVIGGHLGLAVKNGRVILAHGTIVPVRGVETAPGIELASALDRVTDGLARPHRGDRDTGRLVVFGDRLAWEVSAWRGDHEAVAYVDAQTNDVIEVHDNTRWEYTGVAMNHVDERTVGDKIVSEPAAHLRLRTARGRTALTGPDGSFKLAGDGRMFVSANLVGHYVNVQNLDGANAVFIGVMKPEKHHQIEWTESHSLPEERDVFRGTTITNRFVSSVFSDIQIPWLDQPLLAKVNHQRHCNAFWNGSSINFFEAGSGCNNTGRIFDVIAHEWGHGFDQNAPGGAVDGGLGEFIGDLVSFVQTKSPLLGPGFLTDGRAVRDLDDPNFQCYDPNVRQVHAAGQLLGALIFDVMTDLEAAGVKGEQLKRLMLRPIAIAQTRPEWYRGMLAVDDDDGDLTNGTPHECIIYRQYKAHSCKGVRWPGMPDRDPPGC